MHPTAHLIGTLALFAGLSFTASASPNEGERRMSPELLWKLGRLGGSAISNDGGQVAYAVRHYDLAENSGRSTVHLFDVETRSTRAVLHSWASVSNIQFASIPSGECIVFTGRQGKDDSSQAWALNPGDGSLLQLTEVEDGIANLKVSPTGTHIAFTADVKLDAEVTEIYEDLPEADARIIDSLMYRHWNAWHDYAYSHVFVAPLGEDGRAGEALDLMADRRTDCPVPPFGGSEQFAWSPDGRELAITTKEVERWAESTDSDVFLISIEGGEPNLVSKDQPGYDNDPVFTPGGALSYHSMERPSFESDRNRLMLYDRQAGTSRDVTAGLDRTVHGATWLPDGSAALFTSEHRGTNQIFRIAKDGGEAQQVTNGRFNWGLVDVFPDGEHILVSFMNMERPRELAIVHLSDGSSTTITDINGEIYAALELPTVEERWIKATDGKEMHAWVIYPPDFDPNQKWPLITYCQGGPQGQIGQWFSFRWNFHLMAAAGYVIVAPNRRGLPGFGRAWNDQISGDWGGQAMQDILSATDALLAEPYIDTERTAAIGASFGGYTVYWLMGNHGDRFKTMISHCGVFNLESMYGSTEELFFVNWDLGGPYWKSAEIQKEYDAFSPHSFVGNWDTPLLVIHGEKDFRVPITQGMEAFTAAQVQGIPSRFLYYPNEGHWVLGPQNGVVWHRVFFEWLDQYCKSAQEGP